MSHKGGGASEKGQKVSRIIWMATKLYAMGGQTFLFTGQILNEKCLVGRNANLF